MDKIIPFLDGIFLPSPDYIISIIENQEMSSTAMNLIEKQIKQPDSLSLYNLLKGKVDLSEVKAAVSLKTSNRPDRRYQPLFEAAMIKAMAHTLEQKWKYYMVASDISNADITIFNTAISPHGVAIQQNVRLVDKTYPYTKKEDLVALINDAANL